jgi:hypothetical protein
MKKLLFILLLLPMLVTAQQTEYKEANLAYYDLTTVQMLDSAVQHFSNTEYDAIWITYYQGRDTVGHAFIIIAGRDFVKYEPKNAQTGWLRIFKPEYRIELRPIKN